MALVEIDGSFVSPIRGVVSESKRGAKPEITGTYDMGDGGNVLKEGWEPTQGPDGRAIGRGRLPVIGQGSAEASRRNQIVQNGHATPQRGNGKA